MREGALAATVIAVVTPDGHARAAATLAKLAAGSSVRPIVISLGGEREPARETTGDTTVIRGLLPKYLNNAVASLRLSSLPLVGWWCAPDLESIGDLATLVDRLVLDLEDPSEAWAAVPALAARTAITDLRWTSLTRWRDLLAQFFDQDDVHSAMRAPWTLDVQGSDRFVAALLAGWLRVRLEEGARLTFHHQKGRQRIEQIRLGGAGGTLSLRLLSNGTCLETGVELQPGGRGTRVVPLGAQTIERLLIEELRLRARDRAFEDAAEEALRL